MCFSYQNYFCTLYTHTHTYTHTTYKLVLFQCNCRKTLSAPKCLKIYGMKAPLFKMLPTYLWLSEKRIIRRSPASSEKPLLAMPLPGFPVWRSLGHRWHTHRLQLP